MTSTDSATVLGWLKAAGENSRLRLLALCARQELSVSDLAEALRQSEPRVSRHLKILCGAGLVERLRQGQWVHYRLTQNAAAASFAQAVLSQVDRADPLFVRDRGPARPVGVASVRTLESRLGRTLQEFVETVDVGLPAGDLPEGPKSALVVGVEHLELLETAAAVAGKCVAIAHSRRAAQSARAFSDRRGFACRVVSAASSSALCERDIEAAGAPFDVVFLDHLATSGSALDELLRYGRRALAATGRLWLFERYESLEASRAKVVEHPIGRLRRLLGDVGLTCKKLSPIEADGEHVLAAVAALPAAASRGTGTGVYK
jgi:DNA-binding transcriptional ArsR family regulator